MDATHLVVTSQFTLGEGEAAVTYDRGDRIDDAGLVRDALKTHRNSVTPVKGDPDPVAETPIPDQTRPMQSGAVAAKDEKTTDRLAGKAEK